jgi:hypothetical protein
VGLPLAAFGVLAVLVDVARGSFGALVCEGFLGLLGLLAVLQGVRGLIRPGKA